MIISDIAKQKIYDEFKLFEQKQYNGKSRLERKKLNQFFTPPDLSIKIIENLENIKGDLVDPCCGAGNLLMAAAIVKVYDLKENPLTVFGYDIDKNMIKLIRDRFFNYFKIDFSNNFKIKDATEKWKNSFNVCITNPPFNKNGANLLELSIIKMIIENCNESSILCTITNITDINGPLKNGKKWEKYKNVLNGKLDHIEIIKNSNEYFGITVAKELGILKILKSTKKNYDDFRFIHNGINYEFLYKKIYEPVATLKTGLNVHWTDNTKPYYIPLKVLVSKDNYNLITYNNKIINTNTSFKPSTSIKKYDKKNNPIAKNIIFKSEEEVKNFKKLCLTKFYKFLVKHALTSQNIKNIHKFIPYLNCEIEWDDNMLYEYFNLSKEEIKLIENEFI